MMHISVPAATPSLISKKAQAGLQELKAFDRAIRKSANRLRAWIKDACTLTSA
jgi:hypothetical protein